MARGTDSHRISVPYTSREHSNFLPVLLEHLESTESAHEVPTRVTRPACAAPNRNKVVVLCMLGVVALTVSFFRICYEWRGRKDVRRLSSKFPVGESDPELSNILDMCLDMEEANQNVSPTPEPVPQTQPIGDEPSRSTLQHQHSQHSLPNDSMPEDEYFIPQTPTSFLQLLKEPLENSVSGYFRSKETPAEEYPARSTPEGLSPIRLQAKSKVVEVQVHLSVESTQPPRSDLRFHRLDLAQAMRTKPPIRLQAKSKVMQVQVHLPVESTVGGSSLEAKVAELDRVRYAWFGR
ncbi:hypothetical protein ENH_00019600 [Eimeria necatrix]|uniref:Uncharacterized protein n=1 Tax=Eimeria necatrix TaxID=51315 RepID=U6MXF8_9EIME|nr:hypothetical protein ENH_00019600 [Eimeria necatrix]CDJ66395.1 hypothetical protein ENH_00019600 [Eimeria necatrix]